MAVLKHEDTIQEVSKETETEMSFFNKNRLGEKLSSLNIKGDATLIMPGAEKSFWLNNEYHGGNFQFLENLSSQEVELSEAFQGLVLYDRNVDLRDFLVSKLKECFEHKNKNFKKIKVYSAAINYIDKWSELADLNLKNSPIQRKALLESLMLDSPRLNLVVNFAEDEIDRKNTVYDKDLILSGNIRDILCVIYKKDFTPLKKRRGWSFIRGTIIPCYFEVPFVEQRL